MSERKAEMSRIQFLFMVACYVQSSFLYTIYYYDIASHEAWISFLAAMIIGILLAMLYCKLCKLCPEGLLAINCCAFGNIGGKIVSLIYVIVYILSCSRLLRESVQFVSTNLLFGANWKFILIAMLLLCVWAAYHSNNYFSSVATFMCISLFLITIFFFIMLIPQMNIEYLLPFGTKTIPQYIDSVLLSTSMPFSELSIFMLLIPIVNNKKGDLQNEDINYCTEYKSKISYKKSLKKEFITGVVIGSVFVLITIFRDICILGSLVKNFSYPGYEAIRLIDYKLLSHVESLYGAALIFLMFFKSALIFFCILKILNNLIFCKKKLTISIILSIVLFLTTVYLWKSNIVLGNYIINIAPYLLILVNIILPFISLIILLLKQKKNNFE